MENEIWKKVPWFPLYSVSNIGRVKKENYNKTGQERIFLPKPSGRWYIIIHVGGKKFLSLHRMIAFTFLWIPPWEEYQVNHIDGCKTNNKISNLEWVTPRQNVRHSFDSLYRISSPPRWMKNPSSKKIYQCYKDWSKIKLWHWVRAVAEHLWYDHSAIVKCCKWKQNYHKWFRWEYAK